MKTIYLKQKRSGNFELTTPENSTNELNTPEEVISFFRTMYGKKVIKATYRLAQTYFSGPAELIYFFTDENGKKAAAPDTLKIVK
jgi:hypothetical protein